MSDEKQDVSNAKYLFAGIVHYMDRILLTTTIVGIFLIAHAYILHGVFAIFLTAGTIISFLAWIGVVSVQYSWFSMSIGRHLERTTKLEDAIYGTETA